jgi:NADP-dependent 3-hydroxy acid dehydrogenase YdfG
MSARQTEKRRKDQKASDDQASAQRRTVAITGAGGNIGDTVAARFLDRGWNVALFDRGNHVDRLQASFPSALVVTADLTERDQTAEAVGSVQEHWGQIDALAHLAGGFAMGAARETDPDDVEQMLDLNFRTLFTTVQAVLPGLIAQRSGTIVGIAAKQALAGGRNVTAYAASKGALVGYLRALRSEVSRAGVGVGIVFPMGTIDTPENREAMPDTDPQTWISADEMAAALVYLAERTPRGRVDEIRIEAVPPKE